MTVIESFDVTKYFRTGLGMGVEFVAINQFEFERAPKTFHGGVVVTIAFSAHGRQAGGF